MSRIIELNEKPYYNTKGLKVWTGRPTNMRFTWRCYYVHALELLNELLDREIIHYDDIEDYIAYEHNLDVLDGDSEPEELDQFHNTITKLLHEMNSSEIESMISTFTGNAYYQTFENVYEEED